MNLSEYLRPDHGYALLTVIYYNIMIFYLMAQVGKMRKAKNIKYPTMYSPTDQIFNCYQRAHQNTLEATPIYYSLFVPSALVYPCLASALGAIFITSRFFYAWGYYTGEPAKRNWGVWGEVGLGGLFLLSIYITVCQFGILS